MKQWIPLLAVAALFVSCSKANLQEENLQQEKMVQGTRLRSTQNGDAFVSGWEQYTDWNKTDQGAISKFALMRKTPELTSTILNGGLVLSYAKVSNSEPAYASFNNPKTLPFYFLPESERPNLYTHYFNEEKTDGLITLAYQVPFTKSAMPAMGGGASLQAVQFQHVVLSKAFLDSHGLTAQMVRNNYTYEQVMNLVNQ